MTAHWIEVKDEKWSLRSEVVGFKVVSGEHNGWNLGRYFMGMCDRVGICQRAHSKVRECLYCFVDMIRKPSQLYAVTLDNTSNNTTTCETVETLHDRRGYTEAWETDKNQLPCVILLLFRILSHPNPFHQMP